MEFPTLSRRQFVFRSGALLVSVGTLGTSCGSNGAAESAGPTVVQLFSSDRVLAAGRSERISIGLTNEDISVEGESQPYPVRMLFNGAVIDSQTVAPRVVNHAHPQGNADEDHQHSSIQRYFAFHTTMPKPGIYDLEIDINGRTGSLPVQAFDPAEVKVLGPGQPFPLLVSPTVANPDGVDLLCTLAPVPCDFHGETAGDVVSSGRSMAYLVATPAFCRTQYCGPVLDVLIELAPDFPTVTMVHQEVFANILEVNRDIDDPRARFAPQLAELGLEFEPSLFTVGTDGIVVDRIDNVFDNTELCEALARIA